MLLQGVVSGSNLTLRLRFYYTHPLEIRDPIAKHLYFLQAKEQVLNGTLLLEEPVAVELAALQITSAIGSASEHSSAEACVS